VHVADALHRKFQLQDKAEALHRQAVAESRPLTTTEQREYHNTIAQIKQIDADLLRHAELANFDKEEDNPVTRMRLQPGIRHVPEGVSEEGVSLAQWMRNPKLATDIPLRFGTSDGLTSAQITSVAAALPRYAANDAFLLAGSTIYNTDTTTP